MPRHGHIPVCVSKEITWEGSTFPDIFLVYTTSFGNALLLSVWKKYIIGTVTYFKPIPIISPIYQTLLAMFDNVELCWYGEHPLWNMSADDRSAWEQYGQSLSPQKDGFQLIIDALIPYIPHWDGIPDGGTLNCNPPSIFIDYE